MNIYNLINNYFNKKKELVKYLRKMGYKAYETDEYFWIGNRGKWVGTKVYNKLMDEMNKPEYRQLVMELKN